MSSATRRIATILSAVLLASLGATSATVASAAPTGAVASAASTGTVASASSAASTPIRIAGPSPSPTETATDPGLATFGISPASPASPDGRSFVIIGAAPGSVISDNIAVVNQSNFALPLAVYPSEATNAADGTLTLANRDAVTDAGGWLTLGTDSVTVPAQSSAGIGFVVVPITVTIPTDAEPGDHVAAVIASLTTTGSGGTDSPNVNFEQRVGARIYITVGGEAKPGLTVTGVRTSYDPGPWWGLLGQGKMTVTYTLTNSGNVRVSAKARSGTEGLFGLSPRSRGGEQVDELLPHAKVTQTVVVDDVRPLLRTTVSVVAAVGAAPGATETRLGPVSAVGAVWTVPWLWLAALLVVVLVLLRRRVGALCRRLLGRRLPESRLPERRSSRRRRGRNGPDGGADHQADRAPGSSGSGGETTPSSTELEPVVGSAAPPSP